VENWRRTLLPPTGRVRDALTVLDAVAARIALVADAGDRLLGTVTDGDVRRGLLAGHGLDIGVSEIMNRTPKTVPPEVDRRDALRMMNQLGILHLPIVDAGGRLIGLHVLSELLENERRDNWVVLMAGGEGRRLHPITRDIPKPMIPVGGRPILETILNAFLEYGFYKFFISLNYRGEQIRDYFGDGRRWGAEITYLQENEKRGTAGCLSLLPYVPDKPLFVMNGDLLTKVNFKSLLDFHIGNRAAATMCVREYEVEVPFGVVEIEDSRIVGIEEKPVNKYFINSGIYVLDPDCLKAVPQSGVFDMTTLFGEMIGNERKIGSFPIFEYWMDIGRMTDLERAHKDFSLHFGG
jgi:dTDP-glucose pyrophosphorylase